MATNVRAFTSDLGTAQFYPTRRKLRSVRPTILAAQALLILWLAPGTCFCHAAPDPGYADFTAAYQALASRDYDTAIQDFRTGLAKQPDSAHIRKDLAYTLLKTGDEEAARDEFEAALSLDKTDGQAALEYAFLAFETGKPVEARRMFDRLRTSGSPATRKTAAQAFENIDAPLAEGIAYWQGALALSQSSSAHCELARLAALRNDAALAAEHERNCLENKPAPSKVQPSVPVSSADGMTATARSHNLWAFFDSAYRARADADYLARRWRKAGISALHVAAWHNMEPDAAADAYLVSLIEACHRHAILVYAWLELPHVSDKFWADHPTWREKTALGQEAQTGWRKLMNLQNPECSRAAAAGIRNLLARFDWDGVNVAELSFEMPKGVPDPARFTPMNDNVRAEFKEIANFDPNLLFDPASPHANAKDLQTFLKFRAAVASRMESEWRKNVNNWVKAKPYLDVVFTRGGEGGLSLEDVAGKRIGLDLSVVDRRGGVLVEAIHGATESSSRIVIYAENFIAKEDLSSIGAAASRTRIKEQERGAMEVEAPEQTLIAWSGPADIDGKPWPLRDSGYLIAPAGHHRISAGAQSPLTVTDFNGEVQNATASKTEVDVSYLSHSRALAAFDENIGAIEVDGAPAWKAEEGNTERWVLLPAGQHLVTFTRR